MRFKFLYILIFISFLFSEFAAAQQDSVKADSTQLYKNIETFSSGKVSLPGLCTVWFLNRLR